MFKIIMGKGFHISFPNGITLSTQIGAGNYCENYGKDIIAQIKTPASNLTVESNDCEIAIWGKGGNWITAQAHNEIFGDDRGDDVEGYLTFENWLKYFDWARRNGKLLPEKPKEDLNKRLKLLLNQSMHAIPGWTKDALQLFKELEGDSDE